MTAPRRLPRSLTAHCDESLAGYLLNLGHRLGMTPKELAARTGLETRERNEIDVGYAINLPPGAQQALAAATGLTIDAVTRLTLSRYDGHLFDSTSPGRAARTVHGALWVTPPLTAFCPRCLADTPAVTPQRVTWNLNWQTPWAVACPRHQVLLQHACTECGTPVGTSGMRGATLIPRPSHPVEHPAACRATLSATKTICGARLDLGDAPQAPRAVHALQERLIGLLDGRIQHLPSLGVPVTPAQYLRDLRILAVLLQLANDPGALAMLPGNLLDPTAAYLAERHRRRTHRGSHDRADRTWTHPPTDTRVRATLLVTAAAFLDGTIPANQLHGLVTAATRNERLLWARIRSTSEPSLGLGRYFAPGRTGVTTTARLRSAAADRTFGITADHVASYLDETTFQRLFPMVTPTNERNVRRAVPLAITRLISRCSLEDAADLLGYGHQSATAAVVRTGRALGADLRTDWFHDTIADLANDLDRQHSINFGHRRRYFEPDWLIPDRDWLALQQALLDARLARTDTPWDVRRPAYAAWIWSLVTGGDPAAAPMVQATANCGRKSTGGVAQILSTLLRRSPDPLVTLVRDYAATLSAHIDQQPTAVPTGSAA